MKNNMTDVDQLLGCAMDIYQLLQMDSNRITSEMIQKFNLLMGNGEYLLQMTEEQRQDFDKYWNSIKNIVGKGINIKSSGNNSKELLECCQNIAETVKNDPKLLRQSQIDKFNSLIENPANLNDMTEIQKRKFSRYWSIIKQHSTSEKKSKSM